MEQQIKLNMKTWEAIWIEYRTRKCWKLSCISQLLWCIMVPIAYCPFAVGVALYGSESVACLLVLCFCMLTILLLILISWCLTRCRLCCRCVVSTVLSCRCHCCCFFFCCFVLPILLQCSAASTASCCRVGRFCAASMLHHLGDSAAFVFHMLPGIADCRLRIFASAASCCWLCCIIVGYVASCCRLCFMIAVALLSCVVGSDVSHAASAAVWCLFCYLLDVSVVSCCRCCCRLCVYTAPCCRFYCLFACSVALCCRFCCMVAVLTILCCLFCCLAADSDSDSYVVDSALCCLSAVLFAASTPHHITYCWLWCWFVESHAADSDTLFLIMLSPLTDCAMCSMHRLPNVAGHVCWLVCLLACAADAADSDVVLLLLLLYAAHSATRVLFVLSHALDSARPVLHILLLVLLLMRCCLWCLSRFLVKIMLSGIGKNSEAISNTNI